MVNISKNILNKQILDKISNLLVVHILRMKTKQQAKNLIFELLTPAERIQLAKRFTTLTLLHRGYSHTDIAKTLHISRVTIGKAEDSLEKGVYDTTIKEIKRASNGDFSEIIETLIEFSLFKGGRTRLKYFKRSMDEQYRHLPKKTKPTKNRRVA